jgi:hypothetical protein
MNNKNKFINNHFIHIVKLINYFLNHYFIIFIFIFLLSLWLQLNYNIITSLPQFPSLVGQPGPPPTAWSSCLGCQPGWQSSYDHQDNS